jgi:hypothetical protein
MKRDVNHFCVFGSVAWAHILDEKTKALQPKSDKCIFVAYFEDVKGYKLLQPHPNEIIRFATIYKSQHTIIIMLMVQQEDSDTSY